jgi:hypothetical protein
LRTRGRVIIVLSLSNLLFFILLRKVRMSFGACLRPCLVSFVGDHGSMMIMMGCAVKGGGWIFVAVVVVDY